MGSLGKKIAERYKLISDEVDADNAHEHDHQHDHSHPHVHLSEADRLIEEELDALTAEWDEEAELLDPAFGLWYRVLDMIGMLYATIADFDEMRPVLRSIKALSRRYKPDSPYSPVTESYFTMASWADFRFGDDDESVIDIVRHVAAETHGDPAFLTMLEILGNSRASFFEVLGKSARKGLTRVRSIVTNSQFDVMLEAPVPARKGTIWYTRLLPSCVDGEPYHISITQPYVVRGMTIAKLVETLEVNAMFSHEEWDHGPEVTQQYLKFGNGRAYWLDYIMANSQLPSGDEDHLTLLGGPPPPARCRSKRRKPRDLRLIKDQKPIVARIAEGKPLPDNVIPLFGRG